MKLTKRKVLEVCEEGWLLLAESGDDEKPKMFFKYRNECPCCEYASQETADEVEGICDCCPMWNGGITYCMDDDSPFHGWLNAGIREDRKEYAAQVAALARAELDKLGQWTQLRSSIS